MCRWNPHNLHSKLPWDEKCQTCGCVRVCPNSFLKIWFRPSLVIFYPSTLFLHVGSFLHPLPCFAPTPPYPTPPCVCHFPEPGQVFVESCSIPELPVGLDNGYRWEVEGTSLVKEPSRQSTPWHPVSPGLELSFPVCSNPWWLASSIFWCSHLC